jgi:hypothetical protein
MLKILILNIFFALHPVHVTLTSIDQAPGNDTLKVFFRMYYDDFLRDYQLYNKESGFKETGDSKDVPDERLNEFFNDRVQIHVNRKLLTGKLISVSNDGYEICLSLVYKSDMNPLKFKIQNTVLIKIYDDQENMIYININKYQDALRLTQKSDADTRVLK